MYVSNLVLEMTRRCNMRCSHCMRGEPQRLDMKDNVIYRTFRNINEIGTLTLTGGEPQLAVDVMERIYQNIMMQSVRFDYFYVVTNGKSLRNRMRFMNILYKFYQWAEEPESCSLVVSQDQFHRWEVTPDFRHFDGMYIEEYGEKYYREHTFFHPGERKDNITHVLGEGRAIDMSVATGPLKEQEPWEIDRDDQGDISVLENEVYISANGNVTSCCDMSFKRVDSEAIGNITQEPLSSIVERHCVERV